jgi:ferredoxin-NADP reductase
MSLPNRLAGMAAGMAGGIIVAFTAGSLFLPSLSMGEESRLKTHLSLTLGGAGLGALTGLLLAGRGLAPTQAASSSSEPGWSEWRSFRVVRKVSESEEITSFHLEAVDGLPIAPFQPGQFLTIRLQIPSQPNAVIRTYSLSDYSEKDGTSAGRYRISIKREPAPGDLDVPPGLASSFLHDHVQEGSVIEVRPPGGSFVLDPASSNPAVLISNGVGITPMLAMVKAAALCTPDRKVWFFHGARNGHFHAFREEVMRVQSENPNLTVHYAYSKPLPEDEGNYQSKGYVDVPLIRSLVHGEADYFLCGSPPFLESVRTGLLQAGIPEERVSFEMFTSPPAVRATDQEEDVAVGARVTFARSNRTALWQGGQDSLLAFAEAEGLQPPFSCRAGVCGTCMCRLLDGQVSYVVEPTASVKDGSVLICISRPRSGQLTLDI